MGMFDYLTCDMPMPDGRKVDEHAFQTKSLWCGMDLLTITEAGRLIHHRRRYFAASDKDAHLLKHIGDVDLEYHGDIEIHGSMNDGKFAYYTVRFTHGNVEWISPYDTSLAQHDWHPDRDY